MGGAVSTFFRATVFDVAKNAWGRVVHGLSTFAGWLGKEVMSFVASVINGISTIVGKIKEFFINVWHNVEEFTRKIFSLKPTVKDWVWTKTYEIGEGIRNAGIQHMRERLKELSYGDIDSLTDDKVVEKWKEYMSQHPLSAEEQNELEEMLAPPSDSTSSDPNRRTIRSTREYSTLRSLPQESEEFKLRKDHVIAHMTLVLLSPEQLKTGLPKSAPLAPDEEQELHLLLSA